MIIDLANQQPRFQHVPKYSTSAGDEAIEFAKVAGLHLDPWQQLVLRGGLGETPDGKWSAFEVCVVVSRQNGKGSIIEARQLAGLFLFQEELIIHTAHEFKTSAEAFNRIRNILENNDDLRRKVASIKTGKGSEAVIMKNGSRLRFLSRSQGSGRGFSCDCLFLDESMILGEASMAALLPTLSARDNPQVWYLGSAGIGEPSSQLAMLRNRGVNGGDEGFAYFEWSADIHDQHCPPRCDKHLSVNDPKGWLAANPGLPFRRDRQGDEKAIAYMKRELNALGPIKFSQERLAYGSYPLVGYGENPITIEEWRDLADLNSKPGSKLVFAVDLPPDRRSATIASYSVRPDGIGHLEMVERRFGTDWVAGRLRELKEKWNPLAIALDVKGPAGSLVVALEEEGIREPKRGNQPYRGDLFLMSSADMQAACGQLVDGVRHKTFVHLDDEVLTASVQGACAKPVSDSWVWTRRKSNVDVSPLVASTVAKYVYEKLDPLLTDYDPLMSAF